MNINQAELSAPSPAPQDGAHKLGLMDGKHS